MQCLKYFIKSDYLLIQDKMWPQRNVRQNDLRNVKSTINPVNKRPLVCTKLWRKIQVNEELSCQMNYVINSINFLTTVQNKLESVNKFFSTIYYSNVACDLPIVMYLKKTYVKCIENNVWADQTIRSDPLNQSKRKRLFQPPQALPPPSTPL